MKNVTLLDLVKQHEATELFYTNKKGFWVELKEGYSFNGLSFVNEKMLSRLWVSLKSVKQCNAQ